MIRGSGLPAIFVDKDGTLIEDVPYNVRPDLIRLMPGALTSLQRLHRAGYGVVVISNQSGVARGFFPITALSAVEERLRVLLAEGDVPLAGFYYCPHFPGGRVAEYSRECFCRKPQPGLVLQAAREHRLDLTRSWFVGDILDDIEAGHRAGCRAILLDNGHETQWVAGEYRVPDHRTGTWLEVAELILAADRVAVGEGGR